MSDNSDLNDVVILWDIDGTLIEHAPNKRDRHAHAVQQVLGKSIAPIAPGVGKTDRQIVHELFAAHTDPTTDQINAALDFLDAITESDMRTMTATPIDGISQILEHATQFGATHTVLTGNTPKRARIKTTSASLADHLDLQIGFFGHQHADRHTLVAAAAATLSKTPHYPVIVGDTPLDVQAAQAAGIPAIAVATGIYSADELVAYQPNGLIADVRGAHEEFARLIQSAAKP
jgi:phosphoglycolate phosphatase